MVKIFQIVFFITKDEQPFVQLPKLIELEKLHGVDLGNSYATDKACKKFSGYIAYTLRRPLQLHLKSPETTYRYHSVFIDGTTDRSVAEREVIYVKVFKDGEAHMKLMG